jgi:hypothetical protein
MYWEYSDVGTATRQPAYDEQWERGSVEVGSETRTRNKEKERDDEGR